MGTWSLINPAGDELPLRNLGVSVAMQAGTGMPPMHHVALESATEAGALWQRSRAGVRTLTLTMTLRQRDATLNAIRTQLIHALNPHLIGSIGIQSRRALLRYTSPANAVQMSVVYASGLEDSPIAAEERLATEPSPLTLTFLAHDPLWIATAATDPLPLTFAATINGGYVYRRMCGQWSALGNIGGAVNALVFDTHGTLYAAGSFSGYIKQWNATTATWEAVGSGGGPDWVQYALAVGPNGAVYVGGQSASAIVHAWDGSTSTWAALAPWSMSHTVYALRVGDDGTLYAGGDGAGGIKAYNGSTWADLGGGVNNTVRTLARAPDGKLYVGGDFTMADVGSSNVAANHIAVWNPTTATWSALGDGLDGPVYALAVKPDGKLIATGMFSGYIAEWNGLAWRTLGTLNSYGTCLALDSRGTLYAGGNFSLADGMSLPDTMAQWNGYAWFPLDADLPSAGGINAIAIDASDTLIVGSSATGTGTTAALTSITNTGSAVAYPYITINGPGRVRELTNWSTGDSIYFDLVLALGETLIIDLAPGVKSVVSSFRGNVINTILPGSHLASWRLLPGDNTIGLYIVETNANTSASMQWHARYWSVEGC